MCAALHETACALPDRRSDFWGSARCGRPGSCDAVFSAVLAIAPAEITRNAREIPIVRRISIRRCPLLCWAHPPCRRESGGVAMPMVLDALGVQIGVVPDCCRRIRVGQGGRVRAKQGKNRMSTPSALSRAPADFGTVTGSATRKVSVQNALLNRRLFYSSKAAILFLNDG